jgi:methylenetetrahydrofolate reductase (NADPH)
VVPGANIPQTTIDRLAAAANPAAEGVAIAAEQVESYLGVAQGVHLMADQGRGADPRDPALGGAEAPVGAQFDPVKGQIGAQQLGHGLLLGRWALPRPGDAHR